MEHLESGDSRVPPKKSESDTAISAAPDTFDPARLRLRQPAEHTVLRLAHVPVRKPDKAWFIRTHPDPTYWLLTTLLELKESREFYLVEPDLIVELASESTVGSWMLVPSINREGTIFLWPIRFPKPDGRHDSWGDSALQIAERAKEQWTRVQSNMNLGAYEGVQALGSFPPPDWPEMSLAEMVRLAFSRQCIRTLDHPVLKRLRGEM